jgi:hypothetical protein
MAPIPDLEAISSLVVLGTKVHTSNFVDSPKLPLKHGSHLQRGKSLGTNSRKSGGVIPKRQFPMMNKSSTHNIVVVKPAANTEAMDKDPDLLQLQVRNIDIFPNMEKIVDIACYEVKIVSLNLIWSTGYPD